MATYADVAAATPEKIEEVLEAAGSRYKMRPHHLAEAGEARRRWQVG